MRCDHWPAPGPPAVAQRCGCWIYALAVTGLGTIMIAVDYPEIKDIEACKTAGEVFTLLQVWPD